MLLSEVLSDVTPWTCVAKTNCPCPSQTWVKYYLQHLTQVSTWWSIYNVIFRRWVGLLVGSATEAFGCWHLSLNTRYVSKHSRGCAAVTLKQMIWPTCTRDDVMTGNWKQSDASSHSNLTHHHSTPWQASQLSIKQSKGWSAARGWTNSKLKSWTEKDKPSTKIDRKWSSLISIQRDDVSMCQVCSSGGHSMLLFTRWDCWKLWFCLKSSPCEKGGFARSRPCENPSSQVVWTDQRLMINYWQLRTWLKLACDRWWWSLSDPFADYFLKMPALSKQFPQTTSQMVMCNKPSSESSNTAFNLAPVRGQRGPTDQGNLPLIRSFSKIDLWIKYPVV